jgi:hypothetical protein
MSEQPKIVQIPTRDPKVFAFRLHPGFDGDDLRRVADTMDAAFDRQDKVNMLLIMEDMTTADAASGFSLKSFKTQIRGASHVERYAVVGAPDVAASMLETFDKLSSIDVRAFSREDEAEAWRFVGSKPQA